MTNNIYSIPNYLLEEKDETKIFTYIGILKCKRAHTYNGLFYSAFTLGELCEYAGFSTLNRNKNSYLRLSKQHLAEFEKDGLFKVIRCVRDSFNKLKPEDFVLVLLSDDFTPKENFTQITDNEINTIIEKKCSVPKCLLLNVFLYMKSFMFIKEDYDISNFSAFYGDIGKLAEDTEITRHTADKCIDFFLQNHLLYKHETGSYYSKRGIKNAPNIYVLYENKERMNDNIKGAIKRLKFKLLKEEYGNSKKFMPVVYSGKKIKKQEKR